MVPNSSGYPPPACTPVLAASARRSSERLHGVISFHDEAIPICGLSQSLSPMPTARSMPRAGARSYPSVTSRERGFISNSGFLDVMGQILLMSCPTKLHVTDRVWGRLFEASTNGDKASGMLGGTKLTLNFT